MKNIPNTLSVVYSKPLYLLFGMLAAVVSILFLYYATSIPGQSVESWWYITPVYTKAMVLFGGLLLGLIGSVQLYAWREFQHIKKRHPITSFGAFFSTLVATACCSPFLLPLAGLLGFGSAIFFIQKYQLPVVLASFALLLVALYYSCKVVDCEACRVKLKVEEKKSSVSPS